MKREYRLSPSLTSSVQKSDRDPADLIGTLAESNVVFRNSIASGRPASGSRLPVRELSLMMARTSSVIFDFDFDEIVSEMGSWDLRGEKGISIRYSLFSLGWPERKVSHAPLDEEMYGMRKYRLFGYVCH